MAALQLLASSFNWALMACVIYVLFEQRIDYPLALRSAGGCRGQRYITHAHLPLVLEAVFSSP